MKKSIFIIMIMMALVILAGTALAEPKTGGTFELWYRRHNHYHGR